MQVRPLVIIVVLKLSGITQYECRSWMDGITGNEYCNEGYEGMMIISSLVLEWLCLVTGTHWSKEFHVLNIQNHKFIFSFLLQVCSFQLCKNYVPFKKKKNEI